MYNVAGASYIGGRTLVQVRPRTREEKSGLGRNMICMHNSYGYKCGICRCENWVRPKINTELWDTRPQQMGARENNISTRQGRGRRGVRGPDRGHGGEGMGWAMIDHESLLVESTDDLPRGLETDRSSSGIEPPREPFHFRHLIFATFIRIHRLVSERSDDPRTGPLKRRPSAIRCTVDP